MPFYFWQTFLPLLTLWGQAGYSQQYRQGGNTRHEHSRTRPFSAVVFLDFETFTCKDMTEESSTPASALKAKHKAERKYFWMQIKLRPGSQEKVTFSRYVQNVCQVSLSGESKVRIVHVKVSPTSNAVGLNHGQALCSVSREHLKRVLVEYSNGNCTHATEPLEVLFCSSSPCVTGCDWPLS